MSDALTKPARQTAANSPAFRPILFPVKQENCDKYQQISLTSFCRKARQFLTCENHVRHATALGCRCQYRLQHPIFCPRFVATPGNTRLNPCTITIHNIKKLNSALLTTLAQTFTNTLLY